MEEPLSEDRRTCPVCGKQLPAGRSDMRFCSVECKNRYHNLRGGRYRNYRVRVMNALDRNHAILERMLQQGIRSIDKFNMLSLGFIPEYCSSCCRIRGHLEYTCFDIRYHVSDSRIWGIERVDSFLAGR